MKGRRPGAHDGPKSNEAVGDPPPWLAPSAKAEWKRIVKLMAAMGCEVSALHHAALTGYCVCVSDIELADGDIQRDGLTYIEDGRLKKHPASTAKTQALAQMRSFMVELGLTPGSAGKIPKPTTPGKANKFKNL